MGWEVAIFAVDGTDLGGDVLGSFDRSYLMPDGRRCPMFGQRMAWCHACGKFAAAEALPPLTEVDEQIAALRAGAKAHVAHLAKRGRPWPVELDADEEARLAAFVQSLLPEWELYREWRVLRRSPSRCLSCFSTEVDLLPEHEEQALHPVTGKPLTVRALGHVSLTHHYSYDIEGLPPPGSGTCEQQE